MNRLLQQLIKQIDLDEAMRRRSVQQAILEAEADYWRRRADDFDWADCPDVALACRRRAAMIEWEAGADLVDPAKAA